MSADTREVQAQLDALQEAWQSDLMWDGTLIRQTAQSQLESLEESWQEEYAEEVAPHQMADASYYRGLRAFVSRIMAQMDSLLETQPALRAFGGRVLAQIERLIDQAEEEGA